MQDREMLIEWEDPGGMIDQYRYCYNYNTSGVADTCRTKDYPSTGTTVSGLNFGSFYNVTVTTVANGVDTINSKDSTGNVVISMYDLLVSLKNKIKKY